MNNKTITTLKHSTKFRSGTVALLCALMLAACSSIPPPTSQMAVAQSAVQRANTADTRTGAPAELQIAIAKLNSARDTFEREEYVLAGQLAQQAQTDAELAEAIAHAATAELAARESQAAARALRSELNN